SRQRWSGAIPLPRRSCLRRPRRCPSHPYRRAFREAGEVIETDGDASLPAESRALDQQRVRALARRIDRGSQPGRSAPDDDQIVVTLARFGLEAEFPGEFRIGWFDQNRVVFEDDGRNDALAGIPSQYVGFPFLVLFDVHPFVRNELLAQEFLGPAAIR